MVLFETFRCVERVDSVLMTHQGEIEFYNPNGGYGFISSPDFSDDVFFHMENAGLDNEPEEGYEVEFDTEEAEKGPEAVSIEVTDEQTEEINEEAYEDILTGEITHYNEDGGYGFIAVDEVDHDIFFHVENSDLDFEPREGLTVNVNAEVREKGPFAERVHKVESQINDILADAVETEEEEFVNNEYTGTVKYYDEDGGYGFVIVDEYDDDVFFHIQNTEYEEVPEDATVTVTVKQAQEGPQATELVIEETPDVDEESESEEASEVETETEDESVEESEETESITPDTEA